MVLRGQTEGSLKENEVPCSSIERRGKRNLKKEAKNGCRATQRDESKLSKRKREKVGGKGKQISLFSAVCTDIERYVGTNVPESFE